jgi:hypothetical protein
MELIAKDGGFRFMRPALFALLVVAGCSSRPIGAEEAQAAPAVSEEHAPCLRAEVELAGRWHDYPQSNGSWDWNCDAVDEKKLTIDVNCGETSADGAIQLCR